MPLDGSGIWNRDLVVTKQEIMTKINNKIGKLIPLDFDRSSPAKLYTFSDGKGIIGFIPSISEPFCQNCDRVRLTSDGRFLTCLFEKPGFDIKTLLREEKSDKEIVDLIQNCINKKPEGIIKLIRKKQLRPSLNLMNTIGGKVYDLGICKDDKKLIEKKLKNGLRNDLLVITGGSSVGEKDFVPKILKSLGKPGIIVKGVSMKPGSPVTLGMIRKTPIIVCPGFPVSSFFAFFLFGAALLKQMLFTEGPPIPEIHAKMESTVKTQQNVTNFVRVKIRKIKDDYLARPVSTADSRLLITLTGSDGVIIAKNRNELKKGESIKVITFRNFTNNKT